MRALAMIGLGVALAGCGTSPPPSPPPQGPVNLIHYISVERPQRIEQVIGNEHYVFFLDGAG